MSAGLRPYPAYRASGEPWLGEVPEHWTLHRTKTVLHERIERGHPDEPLLAATQTKGVVRKEQYENRTVLALNDLHLLKFVHVGDFVISLRSFQGGIEYAHELGIISPAYTILYPDVPDMHGFLAWLFKSRPYIQNLTLHVTGIREGQNIDYQRLGRSTLPVPPLPEQAAIVRYLNHMDRRTRRFIRDKQKLITLLEEQKRSMSHHAVTRGLDPSVPLRPSGAPWLGDIPQHWEVSRVKSEFRCLDHKRIPLSAVERGAMTLRRYDYYGATSAIDKVDDYLFDDELLLIAEDGANLVLRNLPLAAVVRGKFWVNNHAHILKPTRGNIEFLAAVLEGLNYLPWISGAAQPKLTQDRLMSITIAVPCREEQDAIVAWTASKTAPLLAAIDRARREINLLREYRTRLVADVVTGKVDVRGAAVGLPDESEMLECAEAGGLLGLDEDPGEGEEFETALEEAQA